MQPIYIRPLYAFTLGLFVLEEWTKWFWLSADARHCYSCAGICHSEQCNCQIGSCEADFCFIEKRPTELRGVHRITKGCVRRPSRTRLGCDFDHAPDNLHCLCAGDFCNDMIYLRALQRRNVTCRECPERHPDCGRSCRGEWCYERATTGAAGCGYGPPSLPYFYRGPELLAAHSKICISMSRGSSGMPHRYCICNTDMCNAYVAGMESPPEGVHQVAYYTPLMQQPHSQQRSRSVPYDIHRHHSSNSDHYAEGGGGGVASSSRPSSLPLSECVSCDLTAEGGTMTSNCRQNRCYGHYCTYATQRLFRGGADAPFDIASSGRPFSSAQSSSSSSHQAATLIHERQGCLNTTDGRYVQLGCFHKWMNNEAEELYCACRGNECNSDLATITQASSAPGRFQRANIHSLAWSLLFSFPYLAPFLLHWWRYFNECTHS